jgi:hypothetical protein
MCAATTASLGLPDAVIRLNVEYGVDITYQVAWRLVIAGVLPVEREGTRYLVREEHLPQLARQLQGLSASQPRRRRRRRCLSATSPVAG